MSTEHVLELFDSFWFHSAIFSEKPASPPPPPVPSSSSSATRSSHGGHDGVDEDDRLLLETKLSHAPILHIRSRSDQFSGSLGLGSDPFSPNSVLLVATPKLQTILSGKEVSDFEGERLMTKSEGEIEESSSQNRVNKKSENMRRRKKKKERSKSSKSLSTLEFEELKGFMDLGSCSPSRTGTAQTWYLSSRGCRGWGSEMTKTEPKPKRRRPTTRSSSQGRTCPKRGTARIASGRGTMICW